MQKDERAELGPEIRIKRISLGLTQLQLAEESGVTARTLRNIETGSTVGQPEILNRIESALTRLATERHQSYQRESQNQSFSEQAQIYYDDPEVLQEALVALVEMQANLMRDDLEAVKRNAAKFFQPLVFILSDLVSKSGVSKSDAQADEPPLVSDIFKFPLNRRLRKEFEGYAKLSPSSSIEGHEPPMDAAAHSTGVESAKQRMMREQDEDAERQ